MPLVARSWHDRKFLLCANLGGRGKDRGSCLAYFYANGISDRCFHLLHVRPPTPMMVELPGVRHNQRATHSSAMSILSYIRGCT